MANAGVRLDRGNRAAARLLGSRGGLARKRKHSSRKLREWGKLGGPPFDPHSVAGKIRARMEGSRQKRWSYSDFRHLPFGPVMQALSRMAKRGILRRIERGIYERTT